MTECLGSDREGPTFMFPSNLVCFSCMVGHRASKYSILVKEILI
jgi:hypothetical protein